MTNPRPCSPLAAVAVVLLCASSSLRAAGVDAGEAARGLAQRLLGDDAEKFVFESITADEGRDVFEIESRNEKIIIRGNTGVSMAMGLNWYLKHYCHCHPSWYGDPLKLPDPLPPVPPAAKDAVPPAAKDAVPPAAKDAVPPKVRKVSWAKHRYFLNYCCFGYSLPWWDWPQWERLIDWMALNGINTPLAVTGQEAVWQRVCRKMGLTDQQIGKFLAGPPYLPFGWMGCLDGWGGPLPAGWIDRHEALGRKILDRERAFGMTPVLQGFTGHVPAAIKQMFPSAKLHRIDWLQWQTHLLDPLDPLFAKMARLYMEEQSRCFGTDHLYAADTFIEMTPPSGDLEYLDRLSRAIYAGMAKSDPKAVWVLQGWAFMYQRDFWTQPRIRAFLDAVPDEQMLVLDLFCESTPMWSRTQAFYGKPWVWCNIQNFGNTVFLGGALDRIARDPSAARQSADSGRMVGIGFVNEGLGQNPVVHDLLFESAWQAGAVDLNAYLRRYAQGRYGRADADTEAAWRALHATVYSGSGRSGTRSVIHRVPTLNPVGGVAYSNVHLVEAWRHLLQASDRFGDGDAFRYDLVNVTRQVLSNYAAVLHREVVEAHQAKDLAGFTAASRRFLQLIDDLDALLATRREFLLGRWLEDAKRWGATDAQRAKFEWNARRVLTLWGTGKVIRDYANKEWAGMLSGFYRKRWAMYFQALTEALEAGRPPRNLETGGKAFHDRLLEWEAAWTDGTETYPTQPRGDSVAVAKRLWEKYGDALKPDAPSLTTGKPVACSSTLPPHAARLAADRRDTSSNRSSARVSVTGRHLHHDWCLYWKGTRR